MVHRLPVPRVPVPAAASHPAPHALARRRLAAQLGCALTLGPALGLAGLAQANPSAALPSPGPYGPDTPLGRGADGATVTLGDWPGRAVVVCFWAVWCPHCREELPVLDRIQRAASPEHLRVVLVNTESSYDWRRIRRQMDGQFSTALLHDPDGAVRKAFAAPNSVPYTVVVGRDRVSHATLSGWSSSRTEWLVEKVNAAMTAPLPEPAR